MTTITNEQVVQAFFDDRPGHNRGSSLVSDGLALTSLGTTIGVTDTAGQKWLYNIQGSRASCRITDQHIKLAYELANCAYDEGHRILGHYPNIDLDHTTNRYLITPRYGIELATVLPPAPDQPLTRAVGLIVISGGPP